MKLTQNLTSSNSLRSAKSESKLSSSHSLTAHLTLSNSLRSAKSESKFSSSHSLTAHFSLAEFQRSATAKAKGIDNTIPAAYIPNIMALCENVLEPLREYADRPVVISSGYRCKALNTAVGGVKNSQHMTGEAADIICPPNTPAGTLADWFRWIMNNTSFDQLLFEGSESRGMWIHVSCKADTSKNRCHVGRIKTAPPNLP